MNPNVDTMLVKIVLLVTLAVVSSHAQSKVSTYYLTDTVSVCVCVHVIKVWFVGKGAELFSFPMAGRFPM